MGSIVTAVAVKVIEILSVRGISRRVKTWNHTKSPQRIQSDFRSTEYMDTDPIFSGSLVRMRMDPVYVDVLNPVRCGQFLWSDGQ